MTDKPKRKNSPNRRRKFLLMIVLPIIALMVGWMALSPQINAWLATDPFTPQCHFEHDRLFATGHPVQITSINQGQYEPLDDAGSIRQISWSPDGTMLIARDPNSDEKDDAVLMTTDGEIIHTFEEEVTNTPYWDDDNTTIEFSGHISEYRINIKTWETDSWIVPISGFHIYYSDKSKSPNGRYAPYGMHRDEGVSWYIKDLKEGREWSLSPNGGYVSESSFIGWSDNSRFIYLSIGQMLMQYDVESRQLTDLLELPYVPAVESLSPDSTRIILYDFENSAVFIDLHTLELITLGNKISDHKLGWTPDSRYWIYGEKRNYDVYDSIHVYDVIENTSRQLNIPAGIDQYKVELSPSGRYLKYLRVIDTESQLPSNYDIYDLETDATHTIGAYSFKHRLEWFSHEGKDYLLIQKQVTADRSQPYLTTLMDAETFASCKIGYTSWTLRFQPQG